MSLPNSYVEAPTSHAAFRRQLGLDEIVRVESFSDRTGGFRRQRKNAAIYEPGSESPSNTGSTSMLDFPASGTIRNEFLFFMSHLKYFVIAP